MFFWKWDLFDFVLPKVLGYFGCEERTDGSLRGSSYWWSPSASELQVPLWLRGPGGAKVQGYCTVYACATCVANFANYICFIISNRKIADSYKMASFVSYKTMLSFLSPLGRRGYGHADCEAESQFFCCASPPKFCASEWERGSSQSPY